MQAALSRPSIRVRLRVRIRLRVRVKVRYKAPEVSSAIPANAERSLSFALGQRAGVRTVCVPIQSCHGTVPWMTLDE